ncbi:MAG: hypothetical protein ACFBZ9_12440 [Sphingomonadales bacterium]
MTAFHPLRSMPDLSGYKPGDILVIFGEVFGRGYANGLIDAAERQGMHVIYGTVGRRNADGTPRPLTDDELVEKGHGPIINTPLEAGFERESAPDGSTLVDALNAVGKDWTDASLDFDAIEHARTKGEERFRRQVEDWLAALEAHITDGANVLFAHTMAGGIPASKRVLAVSNRIFKGTGERHQSSEAFWASDMGRACAISFEEVTAKTLGHLIDLSAPLRKSIEAKGGRTAIVAYGYHGTECIMGGSYQWQTYAPYLQGFAKMKLEEIAASANADGTPVAVFNAPEILTNSSGIFVGVELPLYRLILAVEREAPELAKTINDACAAKLEDGEAALDTVREILREYHSAAEIDYTKVFADWPQHNTAEQMTIMIDSSARLRGLHKDSADLMTGFLSRLVFEACGEIMLHKSWALDAPVYWLGHDVIAKALAGLELPIGSD